MIANNDMTYHSSLEYDDNPYIVDSVAQPMSTEHRVVVPVGPRGERTVQVGLREERIAEESRGTVRQSIISTQGN